MSYDHSTLNNLSLTFFNQRERIKSNRVEIQNSPSVLFFPYLSLQNMVLCRQHENIQSVLKWKSEAQVGRSLPLNTLCSMVCTLQYTKCSCLLSCVLTVFLDTTIELKYWIDEMCIQMEKCIQPKSLVLSHQPQKGTCRRVTLTALPVLHHAAT